MSLTCCTYCFCIRTVLGISWSSEVIRNVLLKYRAWDVHFKNISIISVTSKALRVIYPTYNACFPFCLIAVFKIHFSNSLISILKIPSYNAQISDIHTASSISSERSSLMDCSVTHKRRTLQPWDSCRPYHSQVHSVCDNNNVRSRLLHACTCSADDSLLDKSTALGLMPEGPIGSKGHTQISCPAEQWAEISALCLSLCQSTGERSMNCFTPWPLRASTAE